MKGEVQKLAMQFRSEAIERSAIDAEKRTAEIAFSSEFPVERWWGTEILSHDAGACDLTRMNGGAALLLNHDSDQHIGVVESARIDPGAKKGRALVRFGKSALAEEKFQAVQDGILRHVSVGYRINRIETAKDGNGENEIDRVVSWEPVEVSLVAVPADPTVGVGRSAGNEFPVVVNRTIPALPDKETKVMAEQNAAQVADRALSGSIAALCASYGVSSRAEEFITSGKSLNDVKAILLDEKIERQAPPVKVSEPGSVVEIVAAEEDKNKPEKGIRFARFIRSVAASRAFGQSPAEFADKVLGDKVVSRALAAGVAASGGFTVPQDLMAEIIEFLRPNAVVRSLNPRTLPMPNGSLNMPKMTAGAVATYIGENQNVVKTEQAFGSVKLIAKKLSALVPISNDLIRYSAVAVDSAVREDMALGVAQAEDLAFIAGKGTQYSPRGLRNWCLAAQEVTATVVGSLTPQKVYTDLQSLILKLRQQNVRFVRPGWIISPRTEFYLRTLQTTTGNLTTLAAEMLSSGTIFGYPYRVTTQVVENLGSGTDETYVLLADFADVVIGEVPNVIVQTSAEAAYYDGSSVVSAFSLDQTVIKMIIEHDLAVRHQESIAVLKVVRWGL